MQKIIISRDVTFKEYIFPFRVPTDVNKSLARKSRIESTKIEVELTDKHYEATDSTFTDDDASDTVIQDMEDLKDYQLARDKNRRIIKPPLGCRFNLICLLNCFTDR